MFDNILVPKELMFDCGFYYPNDDVIAAANIAIKGESLCNY
ncbi:hypothetical protein ACQ28U_07535 [Staphylococcus cohnii]